MSGDEAGRRGNPIPGTGTRQLIYTTMLEAVGELGYRGTSVEDVVGRGAFSRNAFYRCFTSKEQCFEVAYEREAERLLSAILETCRSGVDWTSGLIEALGTALDFVAEHPLRAQAMLGVGQGAEDEMAAVQQQFFERLTRALDSARRLPGSGHSAPPLTAPLMIGAIENMMRGLLVSGESTRAPSLLPDLTYLIVQSYFDDEAAFAAMDAAKAR